MSASTDLRVYDLRCNDCSFEQVVRGDTGDVFDIIEAHQAEFRGPEELHIVDTALRE